MTRPNRLRAARFVRARTLVRVTACVRASALGVQAFAALATAALAMATPVGGAVVAQSWAVSGVRVFDGETMLERATVVVVDGRIAAVEPGAEVPPEAETIDGAGRTLLPGFIDGHAHSFDDALYRAAVFGTTTVLDMFTEPSFAAEQWRQQALGEPTDRATLLSAGILATAPGGHGTQYGMEIPTLTTPAEAADWVAARVAEGSDFIKIVIEDGTIIDLPTPTLDLPTVTALATAAREHGKLALAHATTIGGARRALTAGVDALVHIFADSMPPADWVAEAAAQGVFVVPTLTVIESLGGRPSGATLAEDPHVGPLMSVRERAQVAATYTRDAAGGFRLANAVEAVRALHEAGVPILAGTDAPNPGTSHGISMHREFELLVSAGLSPAEALAAGTSVPADLFGLDDRGRIAPGLLADLVLVEGNPLEDVKRTRAIVEVWKNGHAVDRSKPEEAIAAPASSGLVADFDDGQVAAAYGTGWENSTDIIMGGSSTVAVDAGEGGAEGTTHHLSVSGEIGSAFSFPWAGAMFYPGAAAFAPVDLSEATELVFWARGEPGTHRVMIFCQSLGPMPTQTTFQVTTEWQQFVLPFENFRGLDPSGLTGILWSGGPGLGPFQFDVDQIEIR